MTKSSIWGVIVIILLVIGGIWAAKQPSSTVPDGEVIKIGVVYGFTGAASTWSDMGKKGIDLAVKEINQNGGVNGQIIEMVYEDSQTNPTKSVLALNKLINVDKVKIVIGDVWSFITNPLIPLAEQAKVTLISPTVMDASAEVSSPYFYSMGHTIESQKDAMIKFFEKNLEVKTVASLCWNDAWGNTNKELFLEVAKMRNVKVVADECLNDFTATYQAELTKIKAANPDAIYFNTSLPDVVLRRIKDLGMGTKKVLTNSNAVDAIEVNKIPVSYMENVYFTNWVPNQEFISKFQEEYGVFPIIEAQNHYDTVRAIAMALHSGGDFNASLDKVKFVGTEGYDINFTKGDHVRMNEGKAGLYIYDGEYKLVN